MTIVLDFWAEWCQPCKQMAPIIDQLEKEYPDVVFKKIDIDKEPEVTEKAGVMSVPTLVIEKDGEEVGRLVGNVGREKIVALL
jgi:thioredoxin 1